MDLSGEQRGFHVYYHFTIPSGSKTFTISPLNNLKVKRSHFWYTHIKTESFKTGTYSYRVNRSAEGIQISLKGCSKIGSAVCPSPSQARPCLAHAGEIRARPAYARPLGWFACAIGFISFLTAILHALLRYGENGLWCKGCGGRA